MSADSQEIAAAVEDLRDDAKVWDSVASALSSASASASGLGSNAVDFSWKGQNALATYAGLVSAISTYLGDGEKAATGGAAVLRSVAKDIEQNEEDNVRGVDGVWRVIDE